MSSTFFGNINKVSKIDGDVCNRKNMTDLADRALRYDRDHVRSLRALAYRMLGSRAEAEDIVQEAWLRWAKVDESTVQHAGAYLSRLMTNLCLGKLGSGTAKREQHIGVWLPEPLLDEEGGWSPGPEVQAEFAQDVGVPLPCGGIEPAGFGLAGDHHVHPRRRGHFTPLC